jgi:hypothetical protein
MGLDLLAEAARDLPTLADFIRHAGDQKAIEYHDKAPDQAQRAAAPPGSDSPSGVVTLATIHSTKGREWEVVAVFDATNDESLGKELETNELEEERRVFYVGMTRAKSSLLVTFRKGRPVRFVQETLADGDAKSSVVEAARLQFERGMEDLAAVRGRLSGLEQRRQETTDRLRALEDGTVVRRHRQNAERLRSEIQDLDSRFQDLITKRPLSFIERIFKSGFSADALATMTEQLSREIFAKKKALERCDGDINAFNLTSQRHLGLVWLLQNCHENSHPILTCTGWR